MFEMKMDMIHAQSYVSMPHPLYILLLYCLVTLQSQTSLCQDRFPGTTDNVDAFPCHCRTGSQCIQDRGMSSGDCECDDQFNPMPWSGPGCQIGNVARAKVATHLELNQHIQPPKLLTEESTVTGMAENVP